ncbi:MAG: KilA-N domain-containing protein [Magnetospirillum sp.]|nr:KilA-N domain-containing protein [Magnetospirillum sp.]
MVTGGETSGTLALNQHQVRVAGERLNLTDLWKAAGSPSGRSPGDWRVLPQGIDFIKHISFTAGKSGSSVIVAKEGRGGGTWAHWQIGLAYGQYLSPEFHAWCNTVVRRHMEGKLVPAIGVSTSGELTTLDPEQQRILGPIIQFMEQSFARVFAEQHDIRELVAGVRSELSELRGRVPQRRREISDATRKRLIATLIHLGCRCPCCGLAEVVSGCGDVVNGAEFDHYYANQLASNDHTWLICKQCHDALTFERMPRAEATPHFMSFQLRRALLRAALKAEDGP